MAHARSGRGRCRTCALWCACTSRAPTETILRRYLSPLPSLTTRLATRLVWPTGGFSIVADEDRGIIGIATVSPATGQDVPAGSQAAELGMLVADQFQRRGIGTALLGAAARQADCRTFAEFVLTMHSSNAAAARWSTPRGFEPRHLDARTGTRVGIRSDGLRLV